MESSLSCKLFQSDYQDQHVLTNKNIQIDRQGGKGNQRLLNVELDIFIFQNVRSW